MDAFHRKSWHLQNLTNHYMCFSVGACMDLWSLRFESDSIVLNFESVPSIPVIAMYCVHD